MFCKQSGSWGAIAKVANHTDSEIPIYDDGVYNSVISGAFHASMTPWYLSPSRYQTADFSLTIHKYMDNAYYKKREKPQDFGFILR